MSPPLVVAFALAGRVDIDLNKDPLGQDKDGSDVFLKDLWPTLGEIRDMMQSALTPEVFRRLYRDFADQNPKWNEISIPHRRGLPMGREERLHPRAAVLCRLLACRRARIEDIRGARPLGIFGDSVTTDHISPAGAIKANSPAGHYLVSTRDQAGGFQQLRQPARQRSAS